MALLLFFIVFIISYTKGTARPLIDSHFSIMTRNGLDGYSGEEMLFKMPTHMKHGTSIHINGILNTNDKMFRVTLGDNVEGTEDCRIMLDFDTETISVTPAIEDYESASYDLHLQEEKQSTFSLRIIARVNNHGKEMLGIHFQVNEEGESPQLICDIKNYENISYIAMEEGVARVDGLFFEFNQNR